MMTLAEAAGVLDGRLLGTDAHFHGVATDSRTVVAGELFVALQGERFDGHSYVAQCARRGAAGALVARPVAAEEPLSQVVVGDTRVALGRLAAAWRERFHMPLVAVTGSNGKTTVKEMLSAILAEFARERGELGATVLATEGNLNNDIGMPLTLLRLREHHLFAVIEMGMNHAGEIDYLTKLARPTVALVNNAHRAHVGMLGSVEAIARAKGEIYAGLGAEGIAIFNADDAHAGYWRGLNAGRRVVGFGMGEDADVRGTLEGNQLRLVTPTDAFALTLQVAGDHNARNAIAACAAAYALEIAPQSIQAGLAGFAGVPGRLQRRAGHRGAMVIDDTYNANPDSMLAALQVLADAPGRKVFVMGDMGELGDEAAAMHAQVGEFARKAGIDALLAVGEASVSAVEAFGKGGSHSAGIDALVAAALAEAGPATTILVKGSRFMGMERVVERLAETGGRHAA